MQRLAIVMMTLALSLAGCSDEGKLVTNEEGCTTSSSVDTKSKPFVLPPKQAAPTSLAMCDLVTGNGDEAVDGKTVSMQYVGVLWDDGKEFDASWNRRPPAEEGPGGSGTPGPPPTFDFVLGRDSVIQGWHQGIAGMKVGGRRELIIPPELGYGPQGSPPVIPQNATLVFVVDLVAVA